MLADAEPSKRDEPSFRVPIVEDDADLADILSSVFSKLGHAARVVRTAEAALEAVRAESYQLLLLDLVLPDGEGFEVAVVARKCSGPRILIAAATGFADVDMRDRARQAGCDLLLPAARKRAIPVPRLALVRALRRTERLGRFIDTLLVTDGESAHGRFPRPPLTWTGPVARTNPAVEVSRQARPSLQVR